MSIPFDPLAFAEDVQAAGMAGGWTIRHLSRCAAGPRPWFQKNEPGAPRIYLSSGIHGDEFSGPLGLLEMMRRPDFFKGFDVTIFPILNPNGLAREIRENNGGIDLNRDYRNSKSEEIQDHIETLKTLGRFDAAMMLHEDYEGIGAYLYELNGSLPQTLGQNIMAAMGQFVPIDQRPVIEELPAQGGVISRSEMILKFGRLEDRPDWPEALYLIANHTAVSYTTETPKPFALRARIDAQIGAVETLLAAFAVNR